MPRTILFLIFTIFLFPEAQSAETDTYNFSWLDPDKEVFVLQNRKYRKNGKFHINLGGGLTTSGAFADATVLQGRAGYFFKEEWGIEFLYSKNTGKENDTGTTLRGNSASSIPFRRIVDGYMGGMIMWSPFYSKINTFNKIIYLDWMVGLGFAKVEETNNRNEFLTNGINTQLETHNHNALMWDTSFKFYINSNWDVRLDLTTLHYKAQKPSNATTEETYYSNWDLTLSFGYSF